MGSPSVSAACHGPYEMCVAEWLDFASFQERMPPPPAHHPLDT